MASLEHPRRVLEGTRIMNTFFALSGSAIGIACAVAVVWVFKHSRIKGTVRDVAAAAKNSQK